MDDSKVQLSAHYRITGGIKSFSKEPLLFLPGEVYTYSGTGHPHDDMPFPPEIIEDIQVGSGGKLILRYLEREYSQLVCAFRVKSVLPNIHF